MPLSIMVRKLVKGRSKPAPMPGGLSEFERRQYSHEVARLRLARRSPIRIGKGIKRLIELEGLNPEQAFRKKFLRQPTRNQDAVLAGFENRLKSIAQQVNGILLRGFKYELGQERDAFESKVRELVSLKQKFYQETAQLEKIFTPQYFAKINLGGSSEMPDSLGKFWHVAAHRLRHALQIARPLIRKQK